MTQPSCARGLGSQEPEAISPGLGELDEQFAGLVEYENVSAIVGDVEQGHAGQPGPYDSGPLRESTTYTRPL